MPKKSDQSINWLKIEGDKTLRLNYDLNENSLVFDLGGYEGQWASDIFSKYCCKIYIFEPVLEFANKIKKRFSQNKKITVFKFGLGNKTINTKISVDNDRSSILIEGLKARNAKIISVLDFMKENNINTIDLFKINIEGGEYDLLEELIKTGFINNIKNIQVQFHNFISFAEKRMKNIQKKLQETHFLTYQYAFIFENWKLREN